jgi:hypothetical protein
VPKLDRFIQTQPETACRIFPPITVDFRFSRGKLFLTANQQERGFLANAMNRTMSANWLFT